MKVYNCFQFYNELDILEIRLQECWDTTDYFVITESNYTHSGREKNYVLLDNWERFKPYADKIRRIQVDESIEEQQKIFPNESNEWVREKYQRWALSKGLHDKTDNDLIIISDLDEIPRSDMIGMIKNDTNGYYRYILNIPHFYYRLNFMRIKPVTHYGNIMVVQGRHFTNPMTEREYTFPWVTPPANTVFLDHGGWHFTWIGNNKQNIDKLQSYCHLDLNRPEVIENYNVSAMISNKTGLDTEEGSFEYVKVDEYFPKCIYENQERWKDLIIPNAELNVEDIYDN